MRILTQSKFTLLHKKLITYLQFEYIHIFLAFQLIMVAKPYILAVFEWLKKTILWIIKDQ